MVREAAKKVIFVMARPIRLYPLTTVCAKLPTVFQSTFTQENTLVCLYQKRVKINIVFKLLMSNLKKQKFRRCSFSSINLTLSKCVVSTYNIREGDIGLKEVYELFVCLFQ